MYRVSNGSCKAELAYRHTSDHMRALRVYTSRHLSELSKIYTNTLRTRQESYRRSSSRFAIPWRAVRLLCAEADPRTDW